MATKKRAKRTASRGRSRGASRRQRRARQAGGGVVVVNMIPRSLSRETNQDSEPAITVNPADPTQIVGTAFTPDPMGGAFGPIFVSTDGGSTWRLNSIVPSAAGSQLPTSDICLAFASAGGRLYGGILRVPTDHFER